MTTKFLKVFENAKIGEITVYTPEMTVHVFKGDQPGPICDIIIKDWDMFNLVLKRGDIGLGEAYMGELWESSDLGAFLTYCSLNLEELKRYSSGSFLNRVFFYIYNNLIRMNTKYGSQKNILEHYDIGNDFYKLWLDPTMSYSSALRTHGNETLEEAQINKYQRIINTLSVDGANLLEIGSGWGGFAEQAIKTGAQVTGITISNEQYHFSKEKLQDKANIVLQDYRDINKVYDRIVSIEMFEAVGERYWQTYFQKIKNSLAKDGKAMIQTITIHDDIFQGYRRESDYIRHYVFPGGMLPSKSIFAKEAAKVGLSVSSMFEFGQDYAWTLKEWYKNFQHSKDILISKNYSTKFLRAWEFYLQICVAGFASEKTNVMQVELVHG